MFVMVKCGVLFEVRTEFLNSIMLYLHEVHEMNAYRAGSVCLSVGTCWTDLTDIWYGRYAI
jgi:hypothetical protein